MSCHFCQKKFGLLHRKAGKDGRCWSCLKAACAVCAPLFDGTELGWVAPHCVCGVCAKQLERQKAKLNITALSAGAQAERSATHATATLQQMPEWTLPVVIVTPADDSAAAKDASSPAASAVPSRLLAPGATRDEARRASRVLLNTVLENYYEDAGTPARRSRAAGEGGQDDDSDSDDVNTPVVARHGRAAQLHSDDADARKRRLSQGILSSLDSLSAVSRQMATSYAPAAADEGLAERLADAPQQQSGSASAAANTSVASNGDFDAELERELAALDTLGPARTATPAPPVAPPVASVSAAVSADDAELLAALDGLDTAVAPATRRAIAADPLAGEGVADALVQIAAASSAANADASVALHEDMLAVLHEVRAKDAQDARLASMFDSMESKLKESLVRTQTPKVGRKKVAEGRYRVGQVVAARNKGDGSWHAAAVQDADGLHVTVKFLVGAQGSPAQVYLEGEVREFLVGNAVDAQCAAAGHTYMPAVVEYHTPSGDYGVRFPHDGSTQLCAPSAVRAPAAALAERARAQQPALPVAEARALGQRCLDVILATLNDNKRAVLAAGISDRRLLLVLGQVLRHLRIMFERPAHEVELFELRLADTSAGDAATYERLRDTVLSSCDYLTTKFVSLHRLVAHPQADADKLNQVVAKIQRIHVWLVNVTARIKAL